jgi:hypothetical protein
MQQQNQFAHKEDCRNRLYHHHRSVEASNAMLFDFTLISREEARRDAEHILSDCAHYLTPSELSGLRPSGSSGP